MQNYGVFKLRTMRSGIHARAIAGGTNRTVDVTLIQVAPLNAARTAQALRPYLSWVAHRPYLN